MVDRLKQAIEASGFSVASFASRANVDPSNFGKMLDGKQKITNKTIDKLCSAHNLSTDWLKFGKGEMYSSVQQNNRRGDNYQGDGMIVNKSNDDFFELLKKKDEQIDRLITIIEKMQEK